MNDLTLFQKLKEAVLQEYQKHFPFWKGTWANFGNKEIAELQSLIEESIHERVSEKWVYTHLKPEVNTKLPRKDMLDILCKWVGYTGWDEFKVKNESEVNRKEKKGIKKPLVLALILPLIILCIVGFNTFLSKSTLEVCFYNQYTREKIQDENILVSTVKEDGKSNYLKVENGCLSLTTKEDQVTIHIESAYYKDSETTLTTESGAIYLAPDNYAMMIRAYMNNNVEDWQKRREKLEAIIADNAEIMEVMNEDIGVDFLNKEEFIDKISIPIKSVESMEVIEIDYNDNNEIVNLKFIQKNEK